MLNKHVLEDKVLVGVSLVGIPRVVFVLLSVLLYQNLLIVYILSPFYIIIKFVRRFPVVSLKDSFCEFLVLD